MTTAAVGCDHGEMRLRDWLKFACLVGVSTVGGGAASSQDGRQDSANIMPPAHPAEPIEREMRNYFGRGMSADAIVSMVLVCKDSIQKSGMMASVQAHAYCVCTADATRRNMGESAKFVVETHSPTKAQMSRCLAFARSADVATQTVTPYEHDPFASSNAIVIGEQFCEHDMQIREKPLRYRMAYCACKADATRSHGDRLYVRPNEERFCAAVAAYRIEAGSFPTPSQVKHLRSKLKLSDASTGRAR
jgi:hypothetical protein